MKGTRRIFVVVFVCACLGLVFPGDNVRGQEGKSLSGTKASGHEIVTIHGVSGISRPTLTVDSGTIVIWVNQSRKVMEIYFTSKDVTMACEQPVHFVVGEDGAFVSDRIPLGSIASLCFVEKGTFEYIARQTSNTPSLGSGGFKGKVVVK